VPDASPQSGIDSSAIVVARIILSVPDVDETLPAPSISVRADRALLPQPEADNAVTLLREVEFRQSPYSSTHEALQ
jgi:hypothetical protein